MKVGTTHTQLAWKAFDPVQASLKYLFLNLNLLILSPTIWAADGAIPVPFELVGNTMFIQASINGRSGNFLFDTGASDLLLNGTHFTGMEERSEVVGLYGEVLAVQHLVARRIEIGGISIGKGLALVLDLSALERVKKLPIAGIIGHSVLKDYEVQIDFEARQIMLLKLKNNGLPVPDGPYASANAFDLKMSGHIPYLEMRFGDKIVRMGIDSGSERNILQPEMLDLQQFEPIGYLKLAGLSPEGKRQEKGYVHDVSLDGLPLEKLEVVLTDLQTVSAKLPVELHGILGVQFLKNYKVAINYELRKIYLWQPKEGANACQLAVCEL